MPALRRLPDTDAIDDLAGIMKPAGRKEGKAPGQLPALSNRRQAGRIMEVFFTELQGHQRYFQGMCEEAPGFEVVM